MLKKPRLIIENNKQNSKNYPLNFGTNLIGRGENCLIRIETDPKISRNHCSLLINDGNALLIDLQSENGTYCNEATIDQLELHWGDSFKIGDTTCLFIYDQETSSSEDLLHPQHENKTKDILTRSLSHLTQNSTIGIYQEISITEIIFRLAAWLNKTDHLETLLEEYQTFIKDFFEVPHFCIHFQSNEKKSTKLDIKYIKQKISFPISGNVTVNDNIFIYSFQNKQGYIYLQLKENIPPQTEEILTVIHFFIDLKISQFRKTNISLSTPELEIPPIIGSSKECQKVTQLIQKVGNTSANILITGPSGCGKEVVARQLHHLYSKNQYHKPFVAVNCGAIAPNLFESSFFGYTKGAFTGAIEDRLGFFELANGGTIFLDELGEMPLEFQSKLLRVLETSCVRKVGGATETPITVRCICATNRNLKNLIQEQKFREDLYFRLQVIEIKIPSLQQRSADIPELINYFLEQNKNEMNKNYQISERTIKTLSSYSWPGNIRQLKNMVFKACTLSNRDDISDEILSYINLEDKQGKIETSDMLSLEDLEKDHILKILEKTADNKSETAKILGITRATLYEKLKRYHIS